MESTGWLQKFILGVKNFIISSKVNKADELNFKKRISSSLARRNTKRKPSACCLPWKYSPSYTSLETVRPGFRYYNFFMTNFRRIFLTIFLFQFPCFWLNAQTHLFAILKRLFDGMIAVIQLSLSSVDHRN